MKKLTLAIAIILFGINVFATGDITLIIKETKRDKRAVPATVTKYVTLTGFENTAELEKWGKGFMALKGVKAFEVKEEYKPGSWNCEIQFEQAAANKTLVKEHLMKMGVTTVVQGGKHIPVADFDKVK